MRSVVGIRILEVTTNNPSKTNKKEVNEMKILALSLVLSFGFVIATPNTPVAAAPVEPVAVTTVTASVGIGA